MPEFTLTGYENRIKSYAAEHAITVTKGKVKTLAFSLCKRQARMTDLDLERILTHSDPTPRDAIRNIERSTAA